MPPKKKSSKRRSNEISNGGTQKKQQDDEVFDDQFQKDVIPLIQQSKRILVLAGAGMSVSCGIPDFRSTGTGLYHTLDFQELGLNSAEDLFDLETFVSHPECFYKFAKRLRPFGIRPSLTHYFLKLLQDKNKLLRVYSQNIDGLEEVAGVRREKIVYAHGSLTYAKCLKCNLRMSASTIDHEMSLGVVPRCKREVSLGSKKNKDNLNPCPTSTTRPAPRRSSKRQCSFLCSANCSADVIENSNGRKLLCNGLIKPDVTMFGEKLNCKVGKALENDRDKVDMVIVIGTSLQVAPMSKVIRYLPPSVPRVLINRNRILLPKISSDELNDLDDDELDHRDGYIFDYELLGNCDDVIFEITRRMGSWRHEIKNDLPKRKLPLENGPINAVDIRSYAFNGASLESLHDNKGDMVIVEIIHCDGCQKEISSDVMKCTNCFDFDLCLKCYRRLRKKHFNGIHHFKRERLNL